MSADGVTRALVSMGTLWALLALSGCYGVDVAGSGIKLTDTRTVPAFNEVETSSVDVFITVGKKQSVIVEGDDNLVPLLTTTVRSGRLVIDTPECYSTQVPAKVTITIPELHAVKCGPAKLVADGVSGSKFDATLTSNGKVAISGTVEELVASLGGSGHLDLEKLPCERAEVFLGGIGKVNVTVSKQLDAQVNGRGEIVYLGAPKVTKRISGGGAVSAK